MKAKGRYPRWMVIFFPALAMMLGWGLRGHIGGGPFGAMIPGAMVALTLSLLYRIPSGPASVLVVFGVIGIGLGGEMTYGQTLGFLRETETVWWGTLGTSLKGGIWGLLGGIVLSIGFIYHKLPKKGIIIAFLVMMAGMIIGFKGINEPMLLYFSDPANPRSESWAALLLGAIALLIFLRLKADRTDFKLVYRFAIWGLVGGGLGFGLGGFWMVLGSNFPDVVFRSWWKAMEFTFGFLLGGALGYAAWINREQIRKNILKQTNTAFKPFPSFYIEAGLFLILALLVHWLIPNSLEPFVEAASESDGMVLVILRTLARIMVNYAFYGLLFVLFMIQFPRMAWQIGISLTFCHAGIDLVRDFFPGINTWTPLTWHFFWIFLMTSAVVILVAWFTRKPKMIPNLFLLLIWSSILISFLRLTVDPEKLSIQGLTICQIICRKFVVDLFFLISAIGLSFLIRKYFKKDGYEKQ